MIKLNFFNKGLENRKEILVSLILNSISDSHVRSIFRKAHLKPLALSRNSTFLEKTKRISIWQDPFQLQRQNLSFVVIQRSSDDSEGWY